MLKILMLALASSFNSISNAMSFCKNYSIFSWFCHLKKDTKWTNREAFSVKNTVCVCSENVKIMMRMNNENEQMFVCKHQSCQLNFIMPHIICWCILFYSPFHFRKNWHFLFIFSKKICSNDVYILFYHSASFGMLTSIEWKKKNEWA